MSDQKELTSETKALLKELYNLCEQYEDSFFIKDILRSKGNKLDSVIYQSVAPAEIPGSDMQLYSEAMKELSIGTTSNGEISPLYKLSNMSDCAEKEFLLALLSLKNRRTETQRLEALGHISRALQKAPNDPRYITLALILQQG